MGNRSKRNTTAARKRTAERYRTIGGIRYDCEDKAQHLAYRRAKYKAEKIKRTSNEAGGEAVPKQEVIP